MKSYIIFLGILLHYYTTCTMYSTSIFPCIVGMTCKFTIFFAFQIFIFKLFFKNLTFLAFPYDSCCSFVDMFIIFFLKLIIFNACFLKDLQKVFIESLPLYTSCLFTSYVFIYVYIYIYIYIHVCIYIYIYHFMLLKKDICFE